MKVILLIVVFNLANFGLFFFFFSSMIDFPWCILFIFHCKEMKVVYAFKEYMHEETSSL